MSNSSILFTNRSYHTTFLAALDEYGSSPEPDGPLSTEEQAIMDAYVPYDDAPLPVPNDASGRVITAPPPEQHQPQPHVSSHASSSESSNRRPSPIEVDRESPFVGESSQSSLPSPVDGSVDAKSSRESSGDTRDVSDMLIDRDTEESQTPSTPLQRSGVRLSQPVHHSDSDTSPGCTTGDFTVRPDHPSLFTRSA